jgi:tight adherence protein C
MEAALAFFSGALGAAGLVLVFPRAGARRGVSSIGARVLRLLARVGSPLHAGRPPRDLEARIAAAGRPAGLGPREIMAAKLTAAAAGATAALLLSPLAPGRLGPLLMLAAPVAGFLGPDLWLLRRARERAARARRELPAMLDLLRVAVEAGSSLTAALGDVGARASGPLAAEWRAVAWEVALGVPPGAALAGMAYRLPLPEVRALAAALDRARRHGAPLGETLAAQARDARFAMRRHVQEQAARAGPKIQLVVALLLVPSVLLLVAAALASALLGSEGGLIPA